ncbi:MAG: hypothetical protein HWD59_07800 [Coxiellaceae bacterium]|nr:MAG: hypothetical protein HWD59_07800 [Coxiellaceae bacterium]
MQTNTSTPSLKRLIITLILLQIIMGVTIGGVNILLTDVLQWIPDNSAVTTGINIASMWLAGYIFGYRQEKNILAFFIINLIK